GQSLAFWSERQRHWKPASLKLCHRVLRRDVPQLDDWSTAGIGTPVRQKRSVVGNRERPALSKAGKVDKLLAGDWVQEPDHTENAVVVHQRAPYQPPVGEGPLLCVPSALGTATTSQFPSPRSTSAPRWFPPQRQACSSVSVSPADKPSWEGGPPPVRCGETDSNPSPGRWPSRSAGIDSSPDTS